MARAHAFVKGNRARISFNDHLNRAETSGGSRCPLEQQATYPRFQQSGLDEELQQVCTEVGDLDLSQPNNSRIAFGHLKVCGLKFIGPQR